jgi:SNF2 family DNA or RNA helicase
MDKFKKLRPVNMTDCKTDATIEDAKHRWKVGDCPLMLGQAGSMGHGLDGLQYSGNIIVWFGLNWSLDLYMQMNARIRRQGQAESVICHRILTKDTFDEVQCDRLEGKDKVQKDLRYSVSEYAKRKYKGGINGQ